MKKLLILTLVGFAFSFGAYASNDVKKQKAKQTKKVSTKVKAKLFTEFCLEAEVYVGECADGSLFIGAVAYFLTDCESGNVYAAAIEPISTEEESCN
jgi:hypothetical protein